MPGQEYDSTYMPGIQNRAIRYYFYLNAGLAIVNNFRNLFLAIIGIYIALHLEAWYLLIVMFVPSVIILTIIGYYVVHKVNKVQEFLSMRFGTHYGIKQFDLQKGIYDELKEMKNMLKRDEINKLLVAIAIDKNYADFQQEIGVMTVQEKDMEKMYSRLIEIKDLLGKMN